MRPIKDAWVRWAAAVAQQRAQRAALLRAALADWRVQAALGPVTRAVAAANRRAEVIGTRRVRSSAPPRPADACEHVRRLAERLASENETLTETARLFLAWRGHTRRRHRDRLLVMRTAPHAPLRV
jgi:hypothetical protein